MSQTALGLGLYQLRHPHAVNDGPLKLLFVEEPCGVPAQYGFGYIQVEFGECIGPDNRYEILRKLGWGLYSSVWLAKDHIENCFVAIKALTGYATFLVKEGWICELDVLRHMASQGKNMTETHCLSHRSHFIQPGKEAGDGEHLCLVMDPMGPSIASLLGFKELPVPLVKKVLRDVLKGLDHLHGIGIVHTDIQKGNIMMDLGKGSSKFDIESYINKEPARRHPPEKTYGDDKYTQVAVSQPFPCSYVKDWEDISFVIGDFGSAQFIDKKIMDEISALSLRAPETILGLPWDEKVDIWATGCLVYESLDGWGLFNPIDDGWDPGKQILHQILSYTGERLPAETIRSSERAMNYLNPETDWFKDDIPRIPKSLLEIVRDIRRRSAQPAVDGLEGLLTKCLRLDSKDRPSAKELLEDPWLRADA